MVTVIFKVFLLTVRLTVLSMAEQLLYTRLARYYDVIYREYLKGYAPRLVDAYEQVFREYARREVRNVLDLACGTGGPTLELARRGYRVVGVDLHKEVVEIAREKAARMGVEVEFKVADAREIDRVFPSGSFDAVTMFFTSLNYMIRLDDLERLLKAVYYVLREDGVFVADTPNPYEAFHRRGSRGDAPVTWSTTGVKTGEWVVLLDWVEVVDWVEGLVKLMRLVTVVGRDGETRSYLVGDTLRYYTATELSLAARSVGFGVVDVLCYQAGRAVRRADRCSRLLLAAVKTEQ